MKRNLLLQLFILLACAASVPGRQQSKPADQGAVQKEKATVQQSPEQVKAKKDDVVRISVTLVQIDAVVTDQQGKLVTDLKPADFELFEDNRRQQITNFSYVTAQPASTEAAAPSSTRANVPLPPTRLRPDQVRRTIALVVRRYLYVV